MKLESEALTLLKSHKVNVIVQDWQDDGSVIITLEKRGEGKRYIVHVKDLYGKHEEVLAENIVDTKAKAVTRNGHA